MQSSKYKLVYPDWITIDNKQIPIVNCLPPKIIDWTKTFFKENQDAQLEPMYSRLSILENQFQVQDSGILFRHKDLYLYFKRHYGEENMVNLDQIDPTDDAVYFFPVELERNNISMFVDGSYEFLHEGNRYSFSLSDIFHGKLLEYIQSGKVKILIAQLTEFSHGNDTLVFLEESFSKINISGTSIVYTCGNTVTNYNGSITQTTAHGTLEQQVAIAHRYPIERSSLGYFCDYVKVNDLNPNVIRNKRFMSWNRTMDRPHRLALAFTAKKYNLLHDGIFSFLNIFHKRDVLSHLEYLYDLPKEKLLKMGAEVLDMLPLEVDTQTLNPQGREGFQTNENNKKELYSDAYLHITSETLFDSYSSPFLSEKTFRPILNLQPFIYLGNYRGLEEIRRLGFKTFDGFINESYDTEQDPKIRWMLIESEIARFANMSKEELHNWYYSLTDILIYNQRHFLSLKNFNPLEDTFKLF